MPPWGEEGLFLLMVLEIHGPRSSGPISLKSVESGRWWDTCREGPLGQAKQACGLNLTRGLHPSGLIQLNHHLKAPPADTIIGLSSLPVSIIHLRLCGLDFCMSGEPNCGYSAVQTLNSCFSERQTSSHGLMFLFSKVRLCKSIHSHSCP